MPDVVIIEDDLDFAHALKECLEEDGDHKVLEILSYEQDAIDWIEANDLSRLCCALVDLSLPMQRGASEASPDAGPRIISKLRRASGFTGSILVLTNSRQLEDGERALQAGCDGYLCKHALISEIPSLVSELKLAMKGNVLLISREMRHVFFREQLSLKEVKLMELVSVGSSWEKISEELGYKTANAAATTGQRVFDKILNAPFEQDRPQAENDLKRSRAIERWQALRKRGAN